MSTAKQFAGEDALLAFYEHDFDYSTAMLSLQRARDGSMSLNFKAATKREMDTTLEKQREAVQEALHQEKAEDPISKVHLAHLLLPIVQMSQQDMGQIHAARDMAAELYGETVNAVILTLECDAETTATVSEGTKETVIEMQGLRLESIGPEGEDRELFGIAVLKQILASDIVEPMTEVEVDAMITALKEDDLMTWELTMELESDEAPVGDIQEDQSKQQNAPAPAPDTYEPVRSRKGKRKAVDEVDEASRPPKKKRTMNSSTETFSGPASPPSIPMLTPPRQQLKEPKSNVSAHQTCSESVSPPVGANKRKRDSADDGSAPDASKKSKTGNGATQISMSQIVPPVSVTFDGKRGIINFSADGKELRLLRDNEIIHAVNMNLHFGYENGTCTNRLTVHQGKAKYQVTFSNGKDGRKQLDDYCVALEELASFVADPDVAAVGSASSALQYGAGTSSQTSAGDYKVLADDEATSTPPRQRAPSPVESAYEPAPSIDHREDKSVGRHTTKGGRPNEVIVIEDDEDEDAVAENNNENKAGKPATTAAASSAADTSSGRSPSSGSSASRRSTPSSRSSNGTASSTPKSTSSTAHSATSSSGPDAETISAMMNHYYKTYLQKGAGENWPGTDRTSLRKLCTDCGIPKKQQKNLTTCRENIAKWLVRHGHTHGSKRAFTSKSRWQADSDSGVITHGFGTVEEEKLAQFNTLRDMSLGKYGADPTKDEGRRGVGARYD